MHNRLPESSLRLGHHMPAALPFVAPFFAKLSKAGFDIDDHRIKPVIRRNGRRIVADYDRLSVRFRMHGQSTTVASIDLDRLQKTLRAAKKIADYAAVDSQISKLVRQLKDATEL